MKHPNVHEYANVLRIAGLGPKGRFSLTPAGKVASIRARSSFGGSPCRASPLYSSFLRACFQHRSFARL
ncbi:hypothetical protein SBA4_2440016 [Candidatus Sulfopaludibacter sp. SbA4]|nr:hypothetical protein SBA4_2440016 [Candidatus Sulfopaludibacter sp. SbA4]